MSGAPLRPVPHDRPKPARPDARPMRAALGIGGLAAMSALGAAIVRPPQPETIVLPVPTPVAPDANLDMAVPTAADPLATPISAERQIQYIQLQPGQVAPPGATVLPATAPTPITVVVTLPPSTGGGGGSKANPKPAANPTPIIIKTTQSGKVVP
jgi:hypothetical protein